MPYENQISARINDPDKYERIRRQNDKFGPGIDVLFGLLADGKTEIQAIRFDAARFTADEARAWLREHDYQPIEFSAATGQEKKRIHAMDVTPAVVARATPASLAALHARAHEMIGDKSVPTEQIERLHGLCIAEMEQRGIPNDTPLEIAPLRGLYMTYPHGELVYQGRKQAFARGNSRSLAGSWIVVSNGLAYGVATIGEPEAVSAPTFDARFSEHRVTTKERDKWWPDKDRLWIHPITTFQPYASPRPVAKVHGANLIMPRVVFQDGEKADPERDRCMKCGSSPVVDVLWADGRGRAWFCSDCFMPWAEEPGDWLELVKAWLVQDGEVPEDRRDHARGDAIGTTDPAQIAKLLETIQEREKALHEGAMVAFFVPPGVANSLIPGDLPGVRALEPDELHMTLAYLGNTADLGAEVREKARQVLGQVAAQLPPISGTVGGVGRFNKAEGDGTHACYASFDAPLLPAFREGLVKALKVAGVPFSTQHGFTPHITLCYTEGNPTLEVPSVEIDFGELVLAWGDDRERFPLRGKVAALKALSTTVNAVRIVRPLEARRRQRHAVAEKAMADETDRQVLGVVTVQAGGHSFTGEATITEYKTRSTGHTWYRYDVEFDPPIPMRGKGDNSWDIGDDHFYSISVPLDDTSAESIEIAHAKVAGSIPLDRLIEDQKGGRGSGNFGHAGGAGGPGNPGGSTSSAGGTAATGPDFTILEPGGGGVDPKEIEDWEGERHSAARFAIGEYNDRGIYSLIMAKSGNETVGVASLREHRRTPSLALAMSGGRGSYMEVSWLGTKRPGYGRQMMDRIVAYAATKKHGVSLGSAQDAKGFYRKIGMNEVKSSGIFFWTPQEVQERAGTKALDDELAALEPQDGVFTTGPIETEAEKGGPGSGNWGHTSTTRIGKGGGGSDPGGGLGLLGLEVGATVGARIVASEQHRRGRGAFPKYPFPLNTRSELASELERIRKGAKISGHEVAFGVTSRGKIVGRDTIGETRSVDVRPIMSAGADTIVHVHPSSSSFSNGDMTFFMSEERARHMMIVGANGTIYRVSKTDKTPTPGQIVPVSDIRRAFAGGQTAPISDMLYHQPAMVIQEVNSTYIDMFQSYAGEQRRLYESGGISRKQAVRNATHRAMLDFSREYGLDYQVAEIGEAL